MAYVVILSDTARAELSVIKHSGDKVTLRSRMHAGDIPALETLADAVLAE